MDKEKLIEETYRPIYNEINEQGLFKTDKQKEKWWEAVNNGLAHTQREVRSAANSNIVTGIEVLANACCDECSKYDNKTIKNGELMPIIPFTDCLELKKGKYCNCCLLKAID